MAFRDDQEAQLARADALEQDLERAKKELENAESERDALRRERDELAEKLGEKGGEEEDDDEPQPPLSSRASKAPMVLAGVMVAVMVAIGVGVWTLMATGGDDAPSPDRRADRLGTVCPIVSGEPLIIVDQNTSSDRRTYHFYYAVYDASTGERSVRVPLTSVGTQTPQCYGYEGDLVWLKTKEHGWHARRRATGELVHRETDVTKLAPSPVHELRFDNNGHHVMVSTKDGRKYHFLAGANPKLVELAVDHQLRNASGVNRPLAGSQWAQLDGDRRVRPSGGDRRRFLIGTAPVGDRDFLRPSLVYEPATNTALWPDPDSLLVVEPKQIDSRVFTLTRYGLDGTVHWTYDPGVDTVHDAFGAYVAGAVPSLVLYFTATAEIIAIDVATGHQKYRVHL